MARLTLQKAMKKTFSLLFGILLLAGCVPRTDPLPNASSRPTPLHFGMYVTPDPKTNPIDPPERFIGYHVATDFEVYPNEADKEIPVYAVCAGKIHYSGFATGYGGVITEYCNLKGQDVTVIYGHLALASLVPAGTVVGTGQTLASLGAAKSHDTDGNRKHLHFGIALEQANEMRGYVETEAEIKLFLDPQKVLKL